MPYPGLKQIPPAAAVCEQAVFVLRKPVGRDWSLEVFLVNPHLATIQAPAPWHGHSRAVAGQRRLPAVARRAKAGMMAA